MGFFAAIVAIKDVLVLAKSLIDFLHAQFGDSYKKFVMDSTQTFIELRKAETIKDKADAAKKLQDLIARLG